MKKVYFRNKTRLLLLALMMALGGQIAMAQSVLTGAAGSYSTYTLNLSTGELRISGEGYVSNRLAALTANIANNIDKVKSLVLEEGITDIGNDAFRGMPNLASVSLPSTLKRFQYQCFADDPALAEIVIPDNVTTMSYSNFSNCTGLRKVTLPKNMAKLPFATFNGCESLEEIMLPASLTDIGEMAFDNCISLKTIVIPSNVATIGESAFSNCSALKSVTIQSSITAIEEQTFNNCSALEDINIPSTVTKIGSRAFYGCENLKSISLPAGLTSLGERVFYACESLSNISFFGSTAPSVAYQCFFHLPTSGVLHVPGGVESNYASLKTDDLEAWTISALQRAGESAYWTYSDNVLTISGSGQVTGLSTPNFTTAETSAWNSMKGTCKKVKVEQGITGLGTQAFIGFLTLQEVSLPTSLSYIAPQVFYRDDKLKSIVLPNGLTSVGSDCFRFCTSLSSVTLPSTLTSISSELFEGCTSLSSIVIPDGVKTIYASAFKGCTALTNIELPSALTSLGASAFEGCTALKEITFHSSKQPNYGTGVFTNLPTNGFLLLNEGTEGLFTSTLNNLPSGWQTANGKCGTSAYYRISKPSTSSYQLSILGQGKVDSNPWLSDGSKITSISIGEGITGIGQAMLGGMPKITSITFPSTLTSLDANVLDRSYGVKELVFQTVTPPTIPLNTYLNTTNWTGEVVCPLAGFNNYKNSQLVKYLRGNWSVSTGGQWGGNLSWKFNSGTEALTLTGVGGDMPDLQDGKQPWYTLNSQVRKAVIDNFTSVGKYAFAHSSIKEIQWPSNPMNLIDYRSFYFCNSLRELTLPAQVERVATNAFETCAQIYSLTVPAGVKALGQEFMPCSRLTHIKFEGQQMPQLNADCGIQNNSRKTFKSLHIRGAVSFPAGADANYESLWSELPEMWRKTDGQLTDHMAYTLRHGVLSLYGHGTTSQLPTNLGGTERSSIDVLNLCQGMQMDNEATFFSGMKSQGCVIYDDGTCFTDQTKLPSGWTTLPSKTEVEVARFEEDDKGSYTSTWQFDHGLLTFGGNGRVIILSTPGWQSYAGAIEKAKLDSMCTITTLEGKIFNDCKALTELKLSNDGRTLKNLEIDKLSDTKIEKLTLPAGLTSLRSSSLHNMTSLKRLNIECLNLKVIPYSAESFYSLYGCTALEEINLVGKYYNETFYDFLSTDAANNLVMGLAQPTKLLINGKGIHTVKISTSETKDRMFNNLSNIKNVVFDHLGTNIVGDIFRGSSVKHVTAYTLYPDNIPASSGLYTTGITLHVPVGAKQAYSNSAGWNRFSKVIDNAFSLSPTLAEENEQTFNTTTSSRAFFPEIVDTDDEYVLTLSPTNMATIEWSDILKRSYLAWNGKAWNGTGDLSVTLNVALKNSPNLTTSVRFNIETDRIILDPTSDYTRTEDMEIEHLGMDLPPIEYGYYNSWMPIYLPIDVDVTEYPELKFAEIYAISPLQDTNGDGKVTLEDDPMMILCPLNTADDMLYANTPYLYRGQASTQSIYLNAANHTLYGAIHEPYDLATAHNTYLLNGLYTNTTVKADDDNFVVDPEHGELTYCEHPIAMKSFSWYMHVTDKNYAGTEALEAMKAKPMKIVTMGEDIDQETAIRIVKEQQGALMQSQYIYSLDGKRIPAGANLPAGIYIKQGKRIVVK